MDSCAISQEYRECLKKMRKCEKNVSESICGYEIVNIVAWTLELIGQGSTFSIVNGKIGKPTPAPSRSTTYFDQSLGWIRHKV
jgi:hypothetical protein